MKEYFSNPDGKILDVRTDKRGNKIVEAYTRPRLAGAVISYFYIAQVSRHLIHNNWALIAFWLFLVVILRGLFLERTLKDDEVKQIILREE